jgi:hypothetical protein
MVAGMENNISQNDAVEIINDLPKFNIGDIVICVGSSCLDHDDHNLDFAGMGWEKGLKFKISHRNKVIGRECYYGGRGGSGVFEKFLELDNGWDV